MQHPTYLPIGYKKEKIYELIYYKLVIYIMLISNFKFSKLFKLFEYLKKTTPSKLSDLFRLNFTITFNMVQYSTTSTFSR